MNLDMKELRIQIHLNKKMSKLFVVRFKAADTVICHNYYYKNS